MGVGKYRAVGFHEGRVPSHSQVGPHILSRLACRVEQTETKAVAGIGTQAPAGRSQTMV